MKKDKSRKKHDKHRHKKRSRSPSASSSSESCERVYYDEERVVSLIRDCILHDPRSSGRSRCAWFNLEGNFMYLPDELLGLFISLHNGGKINISQVPTEGREEGSLLSV